VGEAVKGGPRWAWVLSFVPIIGIIGDVVLIVWAWRRRKREAAAS